ncbi:MAG: class I SAM-dependent methyltransferase [Nanoarchaeota archaeon]|nr:class I SAM-dependent methyltransferase [Nanoarchaeota archaeon]
MVLLAFKNCLNEDLKVLDIGCGNGIITKMIRDKFKCDITGTDILNYAEDIKYRQMNNPYILPFGSNSFDFALMIDALHHIEDQKKAIKEALRVANKLLIYDIEPGFWAWFLDVFLNYITNKKMEKTFTQKTIKEWKHFFDELNLRYRKINFKKPFWYPLQQFAFIIEKN